MSDCFKEQYFICIASGGLAGGTSPLLIWYYGCPGKAWSEQLRGKSWHGQAMDRDRGSRERPGEESEINPDTTCCIFENVAKSDRL